MLEAGLVSLEAATKESMGCRCVTSGLAGLRI